MLKPDNSCVPVPNDADHVINESTGYIYFPEFPNSTCSPDSNCTWVIDLTTSYKSIKLTFQEMSIEECGKHQVMILNGKDNDSLSLGSFCGNKLPNPIHSSTEAVTIKFISDGTVITNGFRLHYKGLKQRRGNHLE